MRLCFVVNEIGKTPSGVVTVLLHLCEGWSELDSIIILTNQKHWACELFQQSFSGKKNISVAAFPGDLVSEWRHVVNEGTYSKWGWKIFMLFFHILELILAPFYIVRLAFWLRRRKIDGVLNHNGGWPAGDLNRWVAIAAMLAGIKQNILVIHNNPSNGRSWLKPFARIRDRFVSFCCAEIITVSQACKNSLETGTGFKRYLHVIYNGIKVDSQSFQHQVQPPWPKKFLTVGFVGVLNYDKGVHVLLRSMAYLKTPCEVVLIGNGDDEYLAELDNLITDSQWPVHFLGFREDANRLYQWLDIVVLASIQFESFGMVLLEAMLWGKPTICSDFGGMKEVVDHEETGLVVPANEPKALAESLERLLEDKILRDRMGTLGRKRLEMHFSMSKMVHNYEALFHAEKKTI
jgi:teichuronic acid biosynthesis glycosyltransferase TuaC